MSSHVKWIFSENSELQVISPIRRKPKNATDIAAHSILLSKEVGGRQRRRFLDDPGLWGDVGAYGPFGLF